VIGAGSALGGTGITKLAGYSRCLSVIASVIPKSMNTALATIFAPIKLGIEPFASLPSDVLHRHFNGSSDLRTMTVTGIGVGHRPRLFSNSHAPALPSLNETATGVIGSFVNVAQPTVLSAANAIASVLMAFPLPVSTCLILRDYYADQALLHSVVSEMGVGKLLLHVRIKNSQRLATTARR